MRSHATTATVLRIWRTRVRNDRIPEYERFANERSLPMFRRQEGFLGVLFARAGEECAVLTLWRDDDAVAQLAISPTYQETVAEITESGLLVGDASVEVYRVHGFDICQGVS